MTVVLLSQTGKHEAEMGWIGQRNQLGRGYKVYGREANEGRERDMNVGERIFKMQNSPSLWRVG